MLRDLGSDTAEMWALRWDGECLPPCDGRLEGFFTFSTKPRGSYFGTNSIPGDWTPAPTPRGSGAKRELLEKYTEHSPLPDAPASSTERSQKAREDRTYRANELEMDALSRALREEEAEWERKRIAGEKAREEREQKDRSEHSGPWIELCALFTKCGLPQLATDQTLSALRREGILPSLYELPCAVQELELQRYDPNSSWWMPKLPRIGLHAAVTMHLNGHAIVSAFATLTRSQVEAC